MQLDTLLARAGARLQAGGSSSPRRDAEVLLCHVLKVERSWLYTWGDREAGPWQRARFEALVAARAQGQPVAYLTGEREFWGLGLATGPSTLIPRPDTETLVEAALALAGATEGALLDLGTGTGAIALAFASERPGWQAMGVDISQEAVELAQYNARRLEIANVVFLQSDWLDALEAKPRHRQRFDLIVANPPYIAEGDPHLTQGDVRFEPRSALVSGDDGFFDLEYLISEARRYLKEGGWLLLEHGFAQGERLGQAIEAAGYDAVETLADLAGRPRVTRGCWPGPRLDSDSSDTR